MRPPKPQAPRMPIRAAAGQVLMAGIEGPQLSAMETAWLKLVRPGGIILFRRNVESVDQTRTLLGEIQSVAAPDAAPLLRTIDVEGGSVDRLRDMIAPMPSPRSVASTGQTDLFFKHGRLIGQELRLLGLNTTFAPVLDLGTPASQSVLGSRTASGDPNQVIRYASHFLRGLEEHQVLGCGKHFPGLGSGQVDSHRSTPQIERPFDDLWEEDLLPYRKMAARLPMVMVSHASYPRTPSGDEPASISPFWIGEILIAKLGCRGLVVSDDMEMGGILSYTSLGDAVVRAILAGAHIVEICRDPALLLIAYEALLHESERSPAFARTLRRAANKVLLFRQKYLPAATLSRTVSPDDAMNIREAIAKFTAEVENPTHPREQHP